MKTDYAQGWGLGLRYPQTASTTKILAEKRTTGSSDWTQVQLAFTVPADYTAGRLDMFWHLQSGTGWIDDIHLQEVTTP